MNDVYYLPEDDLLLQQEREDDMDSRKLFPSTYLKAAEILPGQEVPVTISHIAIEDIGGDSKPVLYFRGSERGLVLNRTNACRIEDAYGYDTDTWSDKPVALYSESVSFQGKMTRGVRIRVPAKPPVSEMTPTSPAPPDIDEKIPF